jgi:hypothetical protein
MTLAEGARQAAADAFFGQEGVTAGRVAREIGERPGGDHVGQFEAQTEQGSAGWHRGVHHASRSHLPGFWRIRRLTKLRGYEQVFRGSITSFRRLTDRAALARQPNQLAIVRIPRSMTLTEFNRAYPSAISLEELALINQLTGADAVMVANFRAKQVVGG